MTNGEALQALDITKAIPLDRGAAAYVPALILLRSDLRAVFRDLEPRRRDIISDAKEAAGAPEDFDARIGEYVRDPGSDPELADVVAEMDRHFVPAWLALLAEEAVLRYPLLTPAQFAVLCADLTAPGAPGTHSVGGATVHTASLLDMIAERLVAPDNY